MIGGYCPGTSLVAIATGKIDALFFVGGVMFGVLAIGEAFPLVKTFYESGNYGRLTLPEVLHLPYGVVVFLVVLMALGGFVLAEWAERRFGGASKEA